MNNRDNHKPEQTQLPLSKSATLALVKLDKLIIEINEAFLKAFHPEGEEAHDAKLIYVKMFEILQIWFKSEVTSDAISNSIHRDSDHGISIKSIKRFFHFSKISLQEGQYDSFEPKKSLFEKLSVRKQNLLLRIMDTYEQLAFFKFLMTNLLAPEFVKAEEEIQEINYENIQYRIKRCTPETVLHTVVPSIYSNEQLEETTQSDERICKIYANLVLQNLHIHYDILTEYKEFSNEIKKVRTAIQEDLDGIDSAILTHNHVTTLIRGRDDIKTRISQNGVKTNAYLRKLKELSDTDIITHEKYIETELPLYINELKSDLSGAMEEEAALVLKYNNEVTQLLARRDENALNATKRKQNLYELLGALSVLPDIPLPPLFSELLRSRAHKEYEQLSADIKVLQRQKRDLDLEIKAMTEAWARINEIRERCELMAERVAQFHKMQLEILQEVQRNISIISSDLFRLCEEQSTVKQTLTFDGIIPSLVDTQGYKNWKNAASLASTGLQSIHHISSTLSAEFEKLGDGSAKQQEGEAISSFIISKRSEVEGSLRSRLESSRKESNELELKINENQKQLLIIQSELNAKLQVIYQNGCSQKSNIDHTLQLDRARFKKQIDAIEFTSANQFEIKSADKDALILKEHKNALLKIKELEACLQEKQAKLNKARLAATEAFFAISGSANEVKKYLGMLSQIKMEGFSLENYGLLDSEYQAIEMEFQESFEKLNVMCGPAYLSRYQLLENKVKDAFEEANIARRLHYQKKDKSSHQIPNQQMSGVTTAAMQKHLDGSRRIQPPQKNNPDDASSSEERKNKSIKQKEPSFWDRHKCKIMLGLTGLFAGAAGGAVAGVFLAPATFGLSVPVCGVICGIVGAIGGLISGLFVGSALDCCCRPEVEDDEPTIDAKPALSVNDDGNQHIETHTVRPVKRSEPRNIRDISRHTQSISGSASCASSPTMFQAPVNSRPDAGSVSALTQNSHENEDRLVVSPG